MRRARVGACGRGKRLYSLATVIKMSLIWQCILCCATLQVYFLPTPIALILLSIPPVILWRLNILCINFEWLKAVSVWGVWSVECEGSVSWVCLMEITLIKQARSQWGSQAGNSLTQFAETQWQGLNAKSNNCCNISSQHTYIYVYRLNWAQTHRLCVNGKTRKQTWAINKQLIRIIACFTNCRSLSLAFKVWWEMGAKWEEEEECMAPSTSQNSNKLPKKIAWRNKKNEPRRRKNLSLVDHMASGQVLWILFTYIYLKCLHMYRTHMYICICIYVFIYICIYVEVERQSYLWSCGAAN